MKGGLVFIVLVIAVVTAAMQHINKKNDQGERIEKLAAGLQGVTGHLSPAASFTLKMPEGAPGDAYMLWRYLLAPRYASIYPQEKLDTVLAIYNMNISDSALSSINAGRKIIYANSDGVYKYYLISNNR